MAEESNIRPSNASIDRRVEKVEEAVHALEASHNEMDKKIDRLELGQIHLREIISARFSAIESGQTSQGLKTDAVGEKLDNFIAKIDSMISEALKTSGDLEATPVGRRVKEELDDLEIGRSNNSRRITSLEKKFAVAMGVITFAMFIFTPLWNLFLPLLRKLLGIE